MAIAVSGIRDVADGVRSGQFQVGNRTAVNELGDLEDIYRELLDGPITAIVAVMGGSGRPNLSPVWFDYEGDTVLLNMASTRKKAHWLRRNPEATFLLMNPANPYHWMSIKSTVVQEISEDDPIDGARVTASIDRMAMKYLGATDGYALRDPDGERRVLFALRVDSVATFGRP